MFAPFQLGYVDLDLPRAMLPAGNFPGPVRSVNRIGIRVTAVRLGSFTTVR
jgi:hypothetical protein